jgi:hypothetical protein
LCTFNNILMLQSYYVPNELYKELNFIVIFEFELIKSKIFIDLLLDTIIDTTDGFPSDH